MRQAVPPTPTNKTPPKALQKEMTLLPQELVVVMLFDFFFSKFHSLSFSIGPCQTKQAGNNHVIQEYKQGRRLSRSWL